MAVRCTPLKDLLEEGLGDYLENTYRNLESHSPKFGYDSDSSNLRIWLLSPSDFELLVTEVPFVS